MICLDKERVCAISYMTTTFVNALCDPIVHAREKPVSIFAIVHSVDVPVWVISSKLKYADTSYVPASILRKSQTCLNWDRSGDPDGQS